MGDRLVEVVICKDDAEIAVRTADIISRLLREKPAAVLGLPTGSSPLKMYEEIVRRVGMGILSLKDVRTFNLDEYVGLPEGHPGSYAAYMRRHLIDKTDLAMENAHLPDGRSADLESAAGAYEEAIRAAGGIDLQILGIGLNGHIGFNEPGSSLKSRTRVKTLSEATLKANAADFEGIMAPTMALTMGIATILEARRVVLLATGPSKAESIAKMVEGPLSANCPASALQMHEKVSVFVDEAAASLLENKKYYERSRALQDKL